MPRAPEPMRRGGAKGRLGKAVAGLGVLALVLAAVGMAAWRRADLVTVSREAPAMDLDAADLVPGYRTSWSPEASRAQAPRRLVGVNISEEWQLLDPAYAVNASLAGVDDLGNCVQVVFGVDLKWREAALTSCATDDFDLRLDQNEEIGVFALRSGMAEIYRGGLGCQTPLGRSPEVVNPDTDFGYDDDYYYWYGHNADVILQTPITECGSSVTGTLSYNVRDAYVFRPPQSGTYTFSACGSPSLRDGEIRVYELDGFVSDAGGTSLLNLDYGSQLFDCDDCGSCGLEPELQYYFTGDTDYVIEMASFADYGDGEYAVQLTCPSGVDDAPFPLGHASDPDYVAPTASPSTSTEYTSKVELFYDPNIAQGTRGALVNVADLGDCRFHVVVRVSSDYFSVPDSALLGVPTLPDPSAVPVMSDLFCTQIVRHDFEPSAPSVLGFPSPDELYRFSLDAAASMITVTSCRTAVDDDSDLFFDTAPRFYVFDTTNGGNSLGDLAAGPFYASGCAADEVGTAFSTDLLQGTYALVAEKDTTLNATFAFGLDCEQIFSLPPTTVPTFLGQTPLPTPGPTRAAVSPPPSPQPSGNLPPEPTRAPTPTPTPASTPSSVPSLTSESSLQPTRLRSTAPSKMPSDEGLLDFTLLVFVMNWRALPADVASFLREAGQAVERLMNVSDGTPVSANARLVVEEVVNLVGSLPSPGSPAYAAISAAVTELRCEFAGVTGCDLSGNAGGNRRERRRQLQEELGLNLELRVSPDTTGDVLPDLRGSSFTEALRVATGIADVRVATFTRETILSFQPELADASATDILNAAEGLDDVATIARTLDGIAGAAAVEDASGACDAQTCNGNGYCYHGSCSCDGGFFPPTCGTENSDTGVPADGDDKGGIDTQSVIIGVTVALAVTVLIALAAVGGFRMYKHRRDYRSMEEDQARHTIQTYLADVRTATDGREGGSSGVPVAPSLGADRKPGTEERKASNDGDRGIELKRTTDSPLASREDEETEL